MTGPDPVVSIPASQTLNNDLVDERPMEEDQFLDFADQKPLGPLPSPTL
jgi:hypothetical protein